MASMEDLHHQMGAVEARVGNLDRRTGALEGKTDQLLEGQNELKRIVTNGLDDRMDAIEQGHQRSERKIDRILWWIIGLGGTGFGLQVILRMLS